MQQINELSDSSSEDNFRLLPMNFVEASENNTVNKVTVKPIVIRISVNDHCIEMELDSGSPVSLIPVSLYNKLFAGITLKPSVLHLSTFTGDSLQVLGVMDVTAKYGGKQYSLKLHVVGQGNTALFGRDWLKEVKLNWKEIQWVNSIQPTQLSLSDIKTRNAHLFSDELGKLANFTAKLYLKETAVPVFMRARPVPYAMRPKIEQELDRLEKEGVLTRSSRSEWGTPIVPIVKGNGQLRLCGDYKITVNPALLMDRYPLPKPQDIFASLAGGQRYSKLDLRQAYLQCEVDEASKEVLTLNTHKGLYKMNRLNFGVSSAPSIWQQRMDQILQGLPYCHCILDDIIVSGRNDTEHLQILDQVCQRLSDNGLRFNKNKCSFLQDKLTYCGHVLTKDGVQQSPDKIAAVINAPAPKNVSQLKSVIGMVMYYANHLPNVSTVMHPLYKLLKKNQKWVWDQKCDQAFKAVKEMIAADTCLVHFDPEKTITLAADASPYGLGAILSHRTETGEKPICFALRTLTQAEQNYSQLDREGLALVWAVKKMYDYIYGRKFILITDNKPIAAILSPTKATPPMVAARLQRWASILSGFEYELENRSTKENTNADFMSRFPVEQPRHSGRVSAIDAFYDSQLDSLPVTAAMVSKQTRKDSELVQVYDYALRGWPTNVSQPLQPYYNRRTELSLSQGCLIWGTRVVIPKFLRQQLLQELHTGHLGIVRMKGIARSFIWWPGIDKDIESTPARCNE